jgi:ATP synthase protein I
LSKNVGEIHQQCLTPPENAAIIAALFDVEAPLKIEVREKKIAHQVVMLQIVVTLIGASIAYSMKGTPQFAIAVLSGGGISVLNGALLAWRMTRETLHPAPEAHHQLRLLYFYAAERFLVVVVLLCLCIAVLKLLPLALLGGFVMGQAVLPAGRLFLSRFKTE